ncbi:MAG: type I restriction enzyme HsdR N-terminal domain-containing protein [Desulfobacteraceae bacterium]|nr:type I restriction enzyme HsdR N-terminal domain-containing protein [Desulfobacteraceae bacterium]
METQSNPHHLVLGNLKDFLTGNILVDTYDERYRQKIAKKLVINGQFKKINIQNNLPIEVRAGEQKAVIKVDFLVKYHKKIIMLIKYAPGSLVTRRLSTLALSRIIKPYQIPIFIITNGKDAEVLDGYSGKVMADGLENLPGKNSIEKQFPSFDFKSIKPSVFDQASRIAYACEVDGACPCDTDICIIK